MSNARCFHLVGVVEHSGKYHLVLRDRRRPSVFERSMQHFDDDAWVDLGVYDLPCSRAAAIKAGKHIDQNVVVALLAFEDCVAIHDISREDGPEVFEIRTEQNEQG